MTYYRKESGKDMKRTAFSPHDKIYIHHLESSKKHNMSVQHYHDSYEVYLQLEGKRYIFYDNVCYTMERGDLAVFPPFVIHYAESREVDYYERYVLNIREEAMYAILNQEETHLLMSRLNAGIIHLSESQLKELCYYYKNAESSLKNTGFLAQKLLFSAVLQLLMYVVKCQGEEPQAKEGRNRISAPVIQALNYINMHYQEEMTLDRIAEVVSVSKYHFSRSFKNITGATVLEYLNNVRLTKAHSLLIYTDATIGEIAEKTGFGSTTNLTRAFKKAYGMSPTKFRKK